MTCFKVLVLGLSTITYEQQLLSLIHVGIKVYKMCMVLNYKLQNRDDLLAASLVIVIPDKCIYRPGTL